MRERELSSRAELIAATAGAMRGLGSEIDALDRRAASHFGISRTDLHTIETLRTAGPSTPTEIARAVGLTSGGLSIALERLEQMGYIRRSPHPSDRRRVLVEVTSAVAPLEAEVFGALIKQVNELLDTYTDNQLATIRDYLERAATTISQAAPTVPRAAQRPNRTGR
jgi:DNA-binding MarR family transcriptional regulator